MQLLSRTLIGLFCFVALASAADVPGTAFDATRLKTGTFTYRDNLDGKPGSLSSCTVARDSENYRFSCDFPAFDQSWNTVATPTMSPVSTELRMRTRGRHYVMTLQYAGLKVSGDAVTSRSADERLPGSDRAVEGDITADTVDQRIDWATVMTTDKRPGESFEFKVYDANTALSRVRCEVGDAGMMDAPGGRIRALRFTYTVYKSIGTEIYTVYASAAVPRVMLREDLPGKLVSTLVKMKQ